MQRVYSTRPTTIKNRIRRQTSFHTYFRSHIYDLLKGRCRNDKDYMGFPFMSKKEWFNFLDETFIERAILFNNWQKSGRIRSLAPSIDRINSDNGYIPDNVRWLTQAENSFHQIPWTRLKTKCKNGHPFDSIDKNGKRICTQCSKALHHRSYLKYKKINHPEWRTWKNREDKFLLENNEVVTREIPHDESEG